MRYVSILLALAFGCKDGETPVDDSSTPTPVDADGDGVTADEDCNDNNASMFPGNTEVCDGLDNNCDGTNDEGVQLTFYNDFDGDGYGAGTGQLGCSAGSNQVELDGDCNDSSDRYHPGADETDCSDANDYNCDGSVGYADGDGDGYAACEECDDGDSGVNPSASEVCDDIDNNCDGTIDEGTASDASIWFVDSDSDGYGDPANYMRACEQPSGTVTDANDCDDTNANANPSAIEVCDGADNNCDGRSDEAESADASTWYSDSDSDGYGDATAMHVACDAPSGTVADSTDCDDSAGAVNPGATELCNGLDDNCDSVVDEPSAADASAWYDDADQDGYGDPGAVTVACEAPSGTVADSTDCDDSASAVNPNATESWYDGVDSDCDGSEDPSLCDSSPGASTVSYDASASATRSTSGWNVAIEWSSDSLGYSAGSGYDQVMMTPVVAQIDDDNGDGAIDEDDIPDVIFTSFTAGNYASGGYLRVFSGDGSGESFAVTTVGNHTVSGAGGVAVADADGDGTPEIYFMSTVGRLVSMNLDGTSRWSSSGTASRYAYPAVYDMDGDGCAEIVAGSLVYGCRGAFLGTISGGSNGLSFVADVDADGQGEIVGGGATWDMLGAQELSSGLTAGVGAIGEFDGDAAAELLNYVSGVLTLVDDDGAILWSTTVSTSGDSPPCVADVDGDGEPEIGVASAANFYLVETDGSVAWTQTTSDATTGTMTCSAFDFDGDGAQEIVYIDRSDLYIWDGAGTLIYQSTDEASGSLYEYAVIADVDGDGEAEIVVPANDYSTSGWTGVVVLGETTHAWSSARRVWNQHAYTAATVNEDNTIPASPDMSWVDDEGFRAQGQWSDQLGGAPNLQVSFVGDCANCSGGAVEVAVAVDNTGSVFAPAGTMLAIYGDTGAGLTLLDYDRLEAPLYPGERTAPFTFTVALASFSSSGLTVAIDPDGEVLESDESDNEDIWISTCP